jgi:hypothetical protein
MNPQPNLTRLSFNPKSRDEWLELRKYDVTSTEVSALFNMSKYMTAYELALVKNGDIEDQFKENERSTWGNRFEESIAIGVSDLYGVRIRKKSEYMRIPQARMGASFDFEIIGIDPDWRANKYGSPILRAMYAAHGNGLLEIKNVDSLIFRNEWDTGDEPEAPPHIEIQLQQQAFVSGLTWGAIGVMVGGNDLRLITRFSDAAVGLKMYERVTKFWMDLGNGIYPSPTHPDDNWIIKKLHHFADPGKLLDATGDKAPAGMTELIRRYEQCARISKKIKDRQETAQAKLLQMIGTHEKVITDIATISCPSVPSAEISYTRKPYRGWKVTPKESGKVRKGSK